MGSVTQSLRTPALDNVKEVNTAHDQAFVAPDFNNVNAKVRC